MTVKLPPLDERALCATRLVRPGSRIADVGCDHAYCAIFLCLTGWAEGGVCSDIRPGPLKRAKENIARYGLSDRLEVCLCDGLDGLAGKKLDDILIMGMGGETIAGILERAPFIKNENTRLILQPMTQVDALRRYLANNGFSFAEETMTKAGGKVYQLFAVSYNGEIKTYSPAQLLLGERNIERYLARTECVENLYFQEELKKRISAVEKRVKGIRKAGEIDEISEKLLSELQHIEREGTVHA